MPESHSRRTIRYRVYRGSLAAGDGAATFVTPSGFPEALSRGEIGYLNRDVWPPQRIMYDRICTDPLEVRSDYVSGEPLLKKRLPPLSEGQAWTIFRANIPLNRGYAFRDDHHWRGHPEDDAARFAGSRVLAIDPATGEIGGTTSLAPFSTEEGRRLAVLAPCLGAGGRFERDIYIAGTYDVRHLVDVDNQWPSRTSFPPTSWATLRSDPGNLEIARLTKTFDDRERYLSSVLQAVDPDGPKPRWAKYNRTLIVGSSLDRPSRLAPRGRWALISTSAVTPPEAFQLASDVSQIDDPVVFELVQGGSFGFGLYDGQRLCDLSQAGREVDYYRGVQGLWFGCLATELSSTNLTRAAAEAPRPSLIPHLEEGSWPDAVKSGP